MLSETEIQDLCARLGLSHQARQVVDRIRSSPPSRNVQGGRGNVCCRYTSQKMGHIVQAESHTLEFPAAYQMEYDPNVLEMWDQPPQIKLSWIDGSGKKRAALHTPDFFVIRSDRIAWQEWKKEKELEQLSQTQPHRYVKNTDGTWRCPPGEEYAKPFGFEYRIRTERDLDWNAYQNLIFLEDYFLPSCPEVEALVKEQVFQLFNGVSYLPLSDLLEQPAPITADVIYTMIVRKDLFCNLSEEPLRNPAYVRIYRDPSALEAYAAFRKAQKVRDFDTFEVTVQAGAPLVWDGQPWILVNLGDHEVVLTAAQGNPVTLSRESFEQFVRDGVIQPVKIDSPVPDRALELMRYASPSDLAIAAQRQEKIQVFLDGEPVPLNRKGRRTIFKHVKLFREADHAYGNGFVGLIPKHKYKGNRNQRISSDVLELADENIKSLYESPEARNASSCYGDFCVACDNKGLTAMSFKSFLRRIKARPKATQLRKREGEKSAYQVEIVHWWIDRATPRHGSRPFEIAHIDHTLLDLEAIEEGSSKNIGRFWLTLMVDAYSRKVIAYYISTEKPSYCQCMLVIRDCVRRYNRLPQFIVTDRGAEFKGTYFQSRLASLQITQMLRPPAQPRFGSIIERLFGVINTEFIHNLRGNTKLTKNVRKLTKSVNPKMLAVWRPNDFIAEFEEYLSDYHANHHSTLGMSPDEAMAEGFKRTGERAFKFIPYTDTFMRLTAPTTPKGRAKVDGARGVLINGVHYWHEIFRRPDVAETSIDVCFEPYNAGKAYGYVKGEWLDLVSEHHQDFAGRTVQEIKAISRDLSEKQRNGNRQRPVSLMRIAMRMRSARQYEDNSNQLKLEHQRKAATNQADAAAVLKALPTSDTAATPSNQNSEHRKPRTKKWRLKHY